MVATQLYTLLTTLEGRNIREVILVFPAQATEIANGADIINVGSGYDVTIKRLATMIKKAIGYKGKIHFDTTKPDGTKRKLMDNSRMRKLGWKPKMGLEEGARVAALPDKL